MEKHKLAALVVAMGAAFTAMAQVSQRSSGRAAQGSVQLQGETDIKAKQENATATASGDGNSARNTAGAIKGGVQIQGNTKIKADQKNASAVASGLGNTAGNEAGVIGDVAPANYLEAKRKKEAADKKAADDKKKAD
ncbi:MAG: hypothetical protein Q7J42_09670, partial [Sulfuritalea sp.]|nr:hypothetical protein [Sulfuritalea sp.]